MILIYDLVDIADGVGSSFLINDFEYKFWNFFMILHIFDFLT